MEFVYSTTYFLYFDPVRKYSNNIQSNSITITRERKYCS